MAKTLLRPAQIANKNVACRLPAFAAQILEEIFDEVLHE